jgi:osmotically inducible lipoprotein OsmB
MRIVKTLLATILLCGLIGGCANMTRQQQRVLSGGAIGAGTGAALGLVAGASVAGGVAIGAAAGAAGGYIYDQSKRKH